MRAERKIYCLFHRIYITERNSSEKKRRSGCGRLTKIRMRSRPDHMWLDIWKKLEKPKHLRSNQFQLFIDIAGKERNSVLYYNLVHEVVPMKRSQESSSLFL